MIRSLESSGQPHRWSFRTRTKTRPIFVRRRTYGEGHEEERRRKRGERRSEGQHGSLLAPLSSALSSLLSSFSSLPPMKILFTGASSFTGYWFVKALADAGHDVTCPLRSAPEKYEGVRKDRVEALKGACPVLPLTPLGRDACNCLLKERS